MGVNGAEEWVQFQLFKTPSNIVGTQGFMLSDYTVLWAEVDFVRFVDGALFVSQLQKPLSVGLPHNVQILFEVVSYGTFVGESTTFVDVIVCTFSLQFHHRRRKILGPHSSLLFTAVVRPFYNHLDIHPLHPQLMSAVSSWGLHFTLRFLWHAPPPKANEKKQSALIMQQT